jgi:hypothetical protein
MGVGQDGILRAGWQPAYGELESDIPRGAGGLMSWAASKAVGHWSRRRAEARLC